MVFFFHLAKHTSEAVLIIVGSQGNSIGVKGAVAFAAALKFTTQLQEFDMSSASIHLELIHLLRKIYSHSE